MLRGCDGGAPVESSPIRKLLVDKHQDACGLLRSAISNGKRPRVPVSRRFEDRSESLHTSRLFITNIQKLCCVMASPQQQIRFEHWANSQSLEAIVAASHDLPEALSLVAHIVSISRFWAARVEGTAEKLAPWPTLTAPELEAELRRLRDRWLRLPIARQ
jgi:hypothetical protein